MTLPGFQRARSSEAKQQREQAILGAARRLAGERGIRQVTLTDIAEAVGMHKSALLRYFETREQIFLLLTAEGWREWSPALRAEVDALPGPASSATPGTDRVAPVNSADPVATVSSTDRVARAFATSLGARPLFCDLLAQAPLNLERNVSLDAVLAFKLVTLEEVDLIIRSVARVLPELTEQNGLDLVAAATSLSGAYFQMATPGPQIELLYRTDPRLTHAVVEVAPRVERTLSALLRGFVG